MISQPPDPTGPYFLEAVGRVRLLGSTAGEWQG